MRFQEEKIILHGSICQACQDNDPAVWDETDSADCSNLISTGNGSQWSRMGAPLLESSPVFRHAIRACAAALRPHRLDLLAEFGKEEGWKQPALAMVGLVAVQVSPCHPSMAPSCAPKLLSSLLMGCFRPNAHPKHCPVLPQQGGCCGKDSWETHIKVSLMSS